jgi:exosortase A-associated hydrolase 1
MAEFALTIPLGQHQLLGIVHPGLPDNNSALLMLVGGPQYRVGSHRQFVQLARYLASQGTTVMRFDYRGMGDSEGVKQAFDQVSDDINAAINALQEQCPHICQVVLWGLCDAASCALIYAYQDARVAGLVLLNPWLRNEQSRAKTMVKHYYLKRLLSKVFWRKLLTGKVHLAASAQDAKANVSASMKHNKVAASVSYQQRMLLGFSAFQGQFCLVLSGQDLTAKEFELQTINNPKWAKLYQNQGQLHRLPDADHTFSCAIFKREVADITLNFMRKF